MSSEIRKSHEEALYGTEEAPYVSKEAPHVRKEPPHSAKVPLICRELFGGMENLSYLCTDHEESIDI